MFALYPHLSPKVFAGLPEEDQKTLIILELQRSLVAASLTPSGIRQKLKEALDATN